MPLSTEHTVQRPKLVNCDAVSFTGRESKSGFLLNINSHYRSTTLTMIDLSVEILVCPIAKYSAVLIVLNIN